MTKPESGGRSLSFSFKENSSFQLSELGEQLLVKLLGNEIPLPSMDQTIISGIMNTSEADMAGIAEASTNIISYVENLNIDSLELVQKDIFIEVLRTCTPHQAPARHVWCQQN